MSHTGGAGVEAQGSQHHNYIQVTPQEKEAIERVSVQPAVLSQ